MLCYAGWIWAEAFDAVSICIVSVCHPSASVLLDPGSTYSYVSTYFATDIDYVCESLVVPITISTQVGESLVVDRIYRNVW